MAAALAYTGAAWYVGMKSEDTIRAGVEQANERIVRTLGPDLGTLGAKIEVREYDRGLFSSDVRYALYVEDQGERFEVELADHMQHGPFPWALVKQGELAPVLAFSRSQLLNTEPVRKWFDAARGALPLQVQTRIGFGGEGVSTWDFAPLEHAVDDERLSFSGGRMVVQFSNGFRNSTGEGAFDSFVVEGGSAGDRFSLEDIRLESQTTTTDDDTVQVHSRLEADRFIVSDAASESFNVQHVSVTLDSRQKAALLDASLRYDLDRIVVGGVDLGSVSLGGELTRFHFEAFSALLAEYDAIAQEHGAGEGEDFKLNAEDEARLLARLVPVLASSPEVAVKPVVWRNEKGESTLELALALQPVSSEGADDGADPLAQAVKTLRVDLVLSRPMVLQAFAQTGSREAERRQLEMLAAIMFDRYVSELEREGLLLRDGDRARGTIVYADGIVDVNGRKMGVEEFLGRYGGFFFM